MENTKNDKERAKKNQGEHCQPVKYHWRQRDQNHKIKIAQHQAIVNQKEVAIIQGKKKFLQLQMSLQRLKNYLSKRNNDLNLEEN